MLFQWCQIDKCTECTFNSDCLGFRVRKFPISTNLDRQDLGIFNANNTQYQGNLMSLFFILQTCSFGKCTGRGGESPRPQGESARAQGEGSLRDWSSTSGFHNVLLINSNLYFLLPLWRMVKSLDTWTQIHQNEKLQSKQIDGRSQIHIVYVH